MAVTIVPVSVDGKLQLKCTGSDGKISFFPQLILSDTVQAKLQSSKG